MKSSSSLSESFEEKSVPTNWHTKNAGELQISTCHFKDGRQSLEWKWGIGGILVCDGLSLSVPEYPQAGISGWIYNENPVDDKLIFCLGSDEDLETGNPRYIFRFGLNYSGWRMFQVQFEADAKAENLGGTIEKMEIIPPVSKKSGCIYLDNIIISSNMSAQRSADYQIPEYSGSLGGWCQHWPLYYSWQCPSLPLPETVTETQKRDFATILARYHKWLVGDQPDLSRPVLRGGAEQFQTYIRRGWSELEALGIVRDEHGRIIGPGLVKNFGSSTSFKHMFYDILMPLVFDYKVNGNETACQTVLDLFDYIHDQGWGEGSALGDMWLLPLGFAPYCHAVVLMRDELRATDRHDTAVRAAFWYLTFGKTFTRFDEEYVETNADALRSVMFTSLAMILAMDDTPQKVQYMNGWLDWYNDALRISPRFTGLIKPDGLGFHHQAIYAGAYTVCAYEFCSLIVWLLHGTDFAAAPESVANLKKALLTQDILTNKYDIPYTVMGRMPRPGIRILSAYAYLALAGETIDADLAGIFMRLWDPNCAYLGEGDKGTNYLPQIMSVDLDAQQGKFLFYQTPGRLQIMQELVDLNLPATPPLHGFWSKPWGALAIHRRKNWMAAVKGWSQYVWDFEMHPKMWAMIEENVFARYWSYGTLQTITHGDPVNPVSSGWNLDKGWDWCRWPGATTKHLTLNENYDPKSSWACRFFSNATFVGGVSSENKNGMFVLKLHEHYHDPSFRAYKSYFFFDNEIICLGSNIQNSDVEHTTETTLFQNWMPDEKMPIQINGESITDFPYEFHGKESEKLTIIDSYNNGYIIPDAGSVKLTRNMQQSRDAWNKGDTTGAFSTCWLDHGHAPKDDGYGSVRYEYVMLVQTDAASLSKYANTLPYRVLLQNHQAHIIEHLTQHTTAYALFETDWVIPYGIVRKTDTPVMIMVKENADNVILSLADPDLRLPKRRNMGYLDDEANATPARSSIVRVELHGKWIMPKFCENVIVKETRNSVTVLEFTCAYGMTSEIILHKGE